jgi:Domain of unknown function (DUF4118)
VWINCRPNLGLLADFHMPLGGHLAQGRTHPSYGSENRPLMGSGSSTSKLAQSDISCSTSNTSAKTKTEALTSISRVAPDGVATSFAGQDLPLNERIDRATKTPLLVTGPFGGFVGHCFLHLCQFLALIHAGIKRRTASADVTTKSLLNVPAHSSLKGWGSCSLGMICSTVVAAGLIPLFNASSNKSFLPIPFLLIIVLVAFWFGRAAGVLGTLAAAFLFAYYLFEPPGLAVGDPVARDHLIWMLVLGIAISDLLARLNVRRQTHKL